MTRLNCREAAHDAERHARNMEEGNAFALASIAASLAAAEAAYLDPNCEPSTARRLHLAMDRMGEFLPVAA